MTSAPGLATPPRPMQRPMQRPSGRSVLSVLVVGLCGLALLPLGVLAAYALLAPEGRGLGLGPAGGEQLLHTLLLVLAVGGGGAVLGTANGWLTACCHFPGRRWLRIAQLLPLATPAYLLAATLIDLGSRASRHIHGSAWAALVLILSTYSYVFLLSTESFSVSGSRQLEAGRAGRPPPPRPRSCPLQQPQRQPRLRPPARAVGRGALRARWAATPHPQSWRAIPMHPGRNIPGRHRLICPHYSR